MKNGMFHREHLFRSLPKRLKKITEIKVSELNSEQYFPHDFLLRCFVVNLTIISVQSTIDAFLLQPPRTFPTTKVWHI